MPTTGATDPDAPRVGLAPDGRVGLLVSVRSAEEASAALAGGADVIDVKEPTNGPLGRAGWETVRAVVDRVAGRVPVTAALGELAESIDPGSVPPGLAVGKIGLAGVGTAHLKARLGELRSRLAGVVPVVPAGYADSAAAGSPPLSEVLGAAIALQCDWMVVDTWDKQGAPLLDCIEPLALVQLIERARKAGVSIVLAGRLSGSAVSAAAGLRPALVGVRGAACEGGRSGVISAARVQSLTKTLATGGAHRPSLKPSR